MSLGRISAAVHCKSISAIVAVLALAGCVTAPEDTPWPSFSNMTEGEKAVVRESFALRGTEEAAMRVAHERFGAVARDVTATGSPQIVPVLVPPGSVPSPRSMNPWRGWKIDILARSGPAVGTPQMYLPEASTVLGWPEVYASAVELGRERTRDFGRYNDITSATEDPGLIRDSATGYYERPENHYWNHIEFGPSLPKILASGVEDAVDSAALLDRAMRLGFRDDAARAALLRSLNAAMRNAIRQDDFVTIADLFVASGLSLIAWSDDTLGLREAGLEYLRAAYVLHQIRQFPRAASVAIEAGRLFDAAVDLELAKIGLDDKAVRDAFVEEMLKPPVTYTSSRTIGNQRITTRTTIYPPTFEQPKLARFTSRLQAVGHQAPIAYAYGLSYYLPPALLADRLEQSAYEFRDRFDAQTASVFLDFAASAHALAATPVHDALALGTALRSDVAFMRSDIAFSSSVDPMVAAGLRLGGVDVKGRARRRCPDYATWRRAIVDGVERPSYASVATLFGSAVASEMQFADRLCKDIVDKLPKK